jgi:hypothetical protein
MIAITGHGTFVMVSVLFFPHSGDDDPFCTVSISSYMVDLIPHWNIHEVI